MVKTNVVRHAARDIVNNHYQRFRPDFQFNKLVVDEVAEIHSKKLRNQIAG